MHTTERQQLVSCLPPSPPSPPPHPSLRFSRSRSLFSHRRPLRPRCRYSVCRPPSHPRFHARRRRRLLYSAGDSPCLGASQSCMITWAPPAFASRNIRKSRRHLVQRDTFTDVAIPHQLPRLLTLDPSSAHPSPSPLPPSLSLRPPISIPLDVGGPPVDDGVNLDIPHANALFDRVGKLWDSGDG